MRKTQLIELLNQIEGNPHILLWNGMVRDWMNICPKLIKGHQTKICFQDYCKIAKYEIQNRRKDPNYKLSAIEINKLKKTYRKTQHWYAHELEPFPSVKLKRRKVIYINAKPRGVKDWNHSGEVNY